MTLTSPTGGAQVVRTSAPSTSIPDASLFIIHPPMSNSYLIETDPRFANYRQWLGSDYMLGQLQLDPSVTQKRLGDGYYEQSLVRAQVAQLTGRRFLGDFMRVLNEKVCDFCRGDIPAAAQAAGLKSLTIFEEKTGRTLYWTPGMTTLKVKKPGA